MQQEKFSISKRLKSFSYAYNGLKILFREEHNARVHALATVLVVILGFALHIHPFEWLAICLVIGLVLAMEIINSAIENIANFLTKDKNIHIKRIKDLSAAAVLISAIIALIVGSIVFLPKIWIQIAVLF